MITQGGTDQLMRCKMQNQSENEEMLNIFDDHKQPIGVATREEVHRMGYWHETFHCWFITLEGNQEYIDFQLRSPQKQDYPNLLDITAAGHLTDRKSTRLNSSHVAISYAVFCLK